LASRAAGDIDGQDQTALEVATQSGSTTALDRPHNPQMRKRQSVLVAILRAIITEDVGQFTSAICAAARSATGNIAQTVSELS
jgi:hypothetical protein